MLFHLTYKALSFHFERLYDGQNRTFVLKNLQSTELRAHQGTKSTLWPLADSTVQLNHRLGFLLLKMAKLLPGEESPGRRLGDASYSLSTPPEEWLTRLPPHIFLQLHQADLLSQQPCPMAPQLSRAILDDSTPDLLGPGYLVPSLLEKKKKCHLQMIPFSRYLFLFLTFIRQPLIPTPSELWVRSRNKTKIKPGSVSNRFHTATTYLNLLGQPPGRTGLSS